MYLTSGQELYHRLRARFVRGSLRVPGEAAVWIRLHDPLLEGEAMTPAHSLLACADSANGISSPLDIRVWQFAPPELTVHGLRPPGGGMDLPGRTDPDPVRGRWTGESRSL